MINHSERQKIPLYISRPISESAFDPAGVTVDSYQTRIR